MNLTTPPMSDAVDFKGLAWERKMATLSVCMIVKDEARALGKALASVAHADEIIVVDTGSTDGTQAIARDFGAQVHEHPWPGDFAAARNLSLSHATQEWVLVLDGDEELAPGTVERIKRFLASADKAVFSLNVTSDMGNDTAIAHLTPRLFPREGTSYSGAIHETPTGWPAVILSDVTIQHSGYRPEVIAQKGKNDRNFGMIQALVDQQPHNPQAHLYLATAHQTAGQHAQAVTHYRMALHLSPLVGLEAEGVRQQAIANLVTVLGILGLHDEADVEARLALRQGAVTHPSFWFSHGNNLNQLGAFHEALAAFAMCLAHRDNKDAQQVDLGVLTWMPWAGMGLAWATLGENTMAVECFDKALAHDMGAERPKILAARDETLGRLQTCREADPTSPHLDLGNGPVADATVKRHERNPDV